MYTSFNRNNVQALKPNGRFPESPTQPGSIAHRQVCIKAEVMRLPTNSEKYLEFLIAWTRELISKVGMKIVIGPNFHYVDAPGNEGWTGGCFIETSHFAIHFWENPAAEWLQGGVAQAGLIQADLYTCGALGEAEIQTILSHLEIFSPIYINYLVIDRERGFIIEQTHDLHTADEVPSAS